MTAPEGQGDTQAVATITKTKLRTVMEAANALTRLGDEDETAEEESQENRGSSDDNNNKEESCSSAGEGEGSEKGDGKRYLPEHKKPDAAPTFPEKLMKMMRYAEEQGDSEGFCVAWLDDGKSFIIRKPDDFTRNVVPKFFKPTKFSSFTRKLYRWGFRQVNRGIGPDDPIIFGNEFFQRDRAELMSKMRSVTAASTRKAEQKNTAAFMYSGMKHPLADSPFDDHMHKRIMADQIYQHKSNMIQNSSYYAGGNGNNNSGGCSTNGTLPLTNALRPNMIPSNNNGSNNNNNISMMMMNGNSMNNLSMNSSMNSSMRGNSIRGVDYNNMNSPFDAMAPLPVHQFMPQQQQQQQQQGPHGGIENGGGGGGGGYGCSSSVPMNYQSNSFYPNNNDNNGQQLQQQGNAGGYPSQQSTAEIVNAAIQALRYAN